MDMIVHAPSLVGRVWPVQRQSKVAESRVRDDLVVGMIFELRPGPERVNWVGAYRGQNRRR